MVETQTPENSSGGSSVLIPGGSGLIGRYLTAVLLSEGYSVSHLSRNSGTPGKVRVFRWNPGEKIADPAIFESADYLIHLAVANIGDKRWTKKEKRKLSPKNVILG